MNQLEEDEHDRGQLFDKVIELLEERRRVDPLILSFDRRPFAFSLSRNGHLLTFQQGPGSRIGSGQIQWRPNPDGDEPHVFNVTRSTFHPKKFRLNNAEPTDLGAIAADIVKTFLQQTEPPR